MPAAEAFDGLARIVRRSPPGMVTVKGDPETLAVAAGVLGAAMPEPLRFTEGEGGRAAWMAPDELLLTPARPGEALGALAEATAARDALVADVPDMRVAFGVEGAAMRDVLTKATPIDLRPAAFGPGAFRRTRLGQVAAALACEAHDRAEVLVMRSVAGYADGLLRTAADPAAPLGLHRA